MKAKWQIGLIVGVLMAVVTGAAYLTQFTESSKKGIPDPVPPTPPDKKLSQMMKFDTEYAIWDKEMFSLDVEGDRAKFIRQVELNADNQYVFWFHNTQSAPLNLGLKNKSCKCSDVEFGSFPAAAWTDWIHQQALTAVLDVRGGGTVLGQAGIAQLLRAATWKALPEPLNPSSPAVPPAGVNGLPSMLRVNFTPKELGTGGTSELMVEVRGYSPEGLVEDQKVFIKYETVPALGYFPGRLDYGEISLSGKRTDELVMWSATRTEANPVLTVSGEHKDDPCIEIGPIVKLSPQETAALPKTMPKPFDTVKATCAYRVQVTVHERRNDRQLDMGPILRRLALTSDGLGTTVEIPLVGMIRGEVKVLGGDSLERIPLGSFRLDQGVSHTVTLVTSRHDLDLVKHESSSGLFDLELGNPEVANGQKRWKLTLTVPPNSTAGSFPAGTAVVLETKEKQPRKLRIPVSGNATHR